MTEIHPLVSIVIPCKNSVKTLGATMESIICQTYKNIEVIVVDSLSNDGTRELARSCFPSARILIAGNERSVQKNTGARAAAGKYLYFVDSDFVLEPGIVSEAVALCEKGSDSVIIHNTSDPRIGFWARVRKLERDCYFLDPQHVAARFVSGEFFGKVGGFDADLLAGEDYDLHTRLVLAGAKMAWAKNVEYHIGEPKTLAEVAKTHIYYGKYLMNYVRKESLVRIRQLSPFRKTYVRNLRGFFHDPRLLIGFLVYQYVRYASAIAGVLASAPPIIGGPRPAARISQPERGSADSVSIVVTTRNRPRELDRCLGSLKQSVDEGAELIVIDDHSLPSIAIPSMPAPTRLIRNEKRRYLNKSRNIGASAASRRYLLFVDDDNFAHQGAVDLLAHTLSLYESVAVAAPMILTEDGLVWYAGGWVSPLSGLTVFNQRGEAAGAVTRRLIDTRLFHSCFMVRKDVFQAIGGFDSVNFPMYLGEADLSEKLRERGWRVVVNPLAVVTHSIERGGITGLLRNVHITEPARAYFVGRNRILYMRRHRSRPSFIVFLTVFQPVLALIHIVTMVGSRGENYKWTRLAGPYLRGWIDGVSGRMNLGRTLIQEAL